MPLSASALENQRRWRKSHPGYMAKKAKEYRQRHPDRVKISGQQYRKEHREEAKLRAKLWRNKHPNYTKLYHQKNKEKRNAYSNNYRRGHLEEDARRSREYRKRHPDKVKNLNQNYYKKNKSIVNTKNRERYNELKKLTFSKYSPNNVIKCRICGEELLNFLTLDHIEGRQKHGHSTTFSAAKLWYNLKKNNFPPGYQVLCWNCNVIKYRETLQKLSTNPKAIRKRQKLLNVKLDVFNHYGKGKLSCACCGFNDMLALGIDHKEGRKIHGHSKSLTSYKLYNELKKKDYPLGYQILCYNCNGAKADSITCPHQRKQR